MIRNRDLNLLRLQALVTPTGKNWSLHLLNRHENKSDPADEANTFQKLFESLIMEAYFLIWTPTH